MDPPKHIPSKTSFPSEGNTMIQVEHNETFGSHQNDMYSYLGCPRKLGSKVRIFIGDFTYLQGEYTRRVY